MAMTEAEKIETENEATCGHNEKVERELQKVKVAKLFRLAEKYGVIHRGWSCINYMQHAAARHGWESTCISGPKGTLKSNLLMQHGLALYGNMNNVREHLVTNQKRLLQLMEYAINNEICIPWIGVDDIAALFPKSLYFTHRKLYSKLQSAWETSRTVFANFEFSCVLKRKVAGFILEDITGDIKCYDPIFVNDTPIKCHYDYRRWLWLRNLKDPTTDIAKLITVEDIPFPATPEAFIHDKELSAGTFYCGGKPYIGKDFFENQAKLPGICTEDFKIYWNERLQLAKESFHDFASILEEAPKKTKDKLPPEQISENNRKAAHARWHPEETKQNTD
jgi:hypothetical protein